MKRLLVMLMVVGLVAVGCGDSDDESASEDSPPVSLTGTVNDHGTETAGDTLVMELDDNYFGPTYVRATSDQTIELELENEGANPHTFTSDQLGVNQEVAPGEKATVTVKAPNAGSVEFHCRFHQAGGMQGAIFVG
jgi:plastocyanin